MIILEILLSIYIFWLFYLAAANLYSAKRNGTLTKTALILGAPMFIVTVLIDVFMNITVASLLFLDRPRHFFVTQRLGYYQMTQTTSWRGKLAHWVCSNFLDSFDPSGKHCPSND